MKTARVRVFLGGFRLLFIFLLFSVFVLTTSGRATAGQLSSRSLFIDSPLVSANTVHTMKFTYASGSSVGSVLFEYCTTPLFADPCTAPTGLNVAGATLQSQTGEGGFGIFSATASTLIISRLATPVVVPQSAYAFANVVNPSATQAFFVRISTYASTDATGAATDAGTVANSTAQDITITTEVPPILNFCVGITIPGDCSTASGNFIQLGNLDSGQTATANSQFWAGTNAQNGYNVTMAGTTMTSGTNVIPALTTPTFSAPGTSQFGVNLRANSAPSTGQDPAGPGPASPTGNYNIANRFMFQSGDTIAATGIPADWQRFTVSYIVNITPVQPAGIYSTTLTYICSAGF